MTKSAKTPTAFAPRWTTIEKHYELLDPAVDPSWTEADVVAGPRGGPFEAPKNTRIFVRTVTVTRTYIPSAGGDQIDDVVRIAGRRMLKSGEVSANGGLKSYTLLPSECTGWLGDLVAGALTELPTTFTR